MAKLTPEESELVHNLHVLLEIDPTPTYRLFDVRHIEVLLSLIDRLAQEPDVVRCGECRRYDDDPKRGGCIPGEIGVCRRGGYRAKPDDFCSYGERKEGQHGTD